MPIKIPNKLPAKSILERENIFVMKESRAITQDIRPLKIAILNLMPNKIQTETQLLRLLGNSPLQVNIYLISPKTHTSKNTPKEHLISFYKSFEEIKNEKFDGMIITGAPVEKLQFEEVDYFEELKEIMEWSKNNVTSTFHICWAAQAAFYHHFKIDKKLLREKIFGVFRHEILEPTSELIRGFDSYFYAPHSRHTTIYEEELGGIKELTVLAKSEEAGIHLAASLDKKQVFMFGHMEYEKNTLADEYFRDLEKDDKVLPPKNYFDEGKIPNSTWNAHAHLLFSNWLNYFVYQITPYNIEEEL